MDVQTCWHGCRATLRSHPWRYKEYKGKRSCMRMYCTWYFKSPSHRSTQSCDLHCHQQALILANLPQHVPCQYMLKSRLGTRQLYLKLGPDRISRPIFLPPLLVPRVLNIQVDSLTNVPRVPVNPRFPIQQPSS
jgi:hypothetical protein